MWNLRIVEASLPLLLSRFLHALTNLCRRLAVAFAAEFLIGNRGNLDVHIDAVEKGSAYLSDVALNDSGSTAALPRAISVEPARAGVIVLTG